MFSHQGLVKEHLDGNEAWLRSRINGEKSFTLLATTLLSHCSPNLEARE